MNSDSGLFFKEPKPGIMLFKGDAIQVTNRLINEFGAKFADAIITDPPYGCVLEGEKQPNKDIPAFLDKDIWEIVWKSVKDDGAVLMFNEGAAWVKLVYSGFKYFRYNYAFDSKKNRGHLNCNRMPMLRHGLIAVFYKKKPTYNPQLDDEVFDGHYPCDMLKYVRDGKRESYPHERNVNVLEFLVKTYTNEGDTVFDFCMGAGSLAEACYKTNRKFVGIELIDETYDKAYKRIRDL